MTQISVLYPWALYHGGGVAGDYGQVDEGGWSFYLRAIPIVHAPEPSLPCPPVPIFTAAFTSPRR